MIRQQILEKLEELEDVGNSIYKCNKTREIILSRVDTIKALLDKAILFPAGKNINNISGNIVSKDILD